MKTLLIGASGLMGTALQAEKPENFSIVPVDHSDLEITDSAQLQKILDDEKPGFVINTAAFLGVESCAASPSDAFAVNTEAVRMLSGMCEERNICLIHFSTDAVFDGRKGEAYTEDDIPEPVNLYGMTKYMGELFVKNRIRRHYIVRLPILFGTRRNKGGIFIEKMYRKVLEGTGHLKIADDIISCPSFSKDIAKGVFELMESGAEYGLYHMKNEGTASLFEFAGRFFEIMGVPVRISRAKAADFSAGETEIKPLNTAIRSKKIGHRRPWQDAMMDYVGLLNKLQGVS